MRAPDAAWKGSSDPSLSSARTISPLHVMQMSREPTPPAAPSRHRAALLVLGSQLMAAVLHALAKLLETRSGAQGSVHPFTILQIRLFITTLGCSAYLGWTKEPDFPLGQRKLRPLLALRALGGIFGACGFYVSFAYLSLSEATALNFLAPLGALILTKYLDNGQLAIMDGVSCTIALASVVLVLQPKAIFGAAAVAQARELASNVAMDPHASLKGTLAGIIGVAGGIVALSAIHRLGTRAHPLLSVNYFSCSVFMVTTVASFLTPGATWPTDLTSWCLLVLLGLVGFCMEYLLTAGVGSSKSPSATIMIYSQVIWAILLDLLIWNSGVNSLTILGCIGVVASLATTSLVDDLKGLGETAPHLALESEMEEIDAELDNMYASRYSLG